jgi:peptide chain release factor 1
MYSKYFEAQRWKVEVLETNHSEVGGFKEITLAVNGAGAWRRLRSESGGHRVQRVPSTETQGRIHTSAATVAVLPEAEEAEIALRDEDMRIDTMRSSGPGGQSVNKTSSAVRITHLPTNTVVSCQDEKSQHKNKAKALRILRSRLMEAERARLHDERAATRKSQVGTGDRSARVRTYNFPQNRVTDHRLGQNFSLEQVIEGRLEPIFEALQALDREERLRNL